MKNKDHQDKITGDFVLTLKKQLHNHCFLYKYFFKKQIRFAY